MKTIKIVLLSLAIFAGIYFFLDLGTPSVKLCGKFLVEDYWGDIPNLLYDKESNDGWRTGLVSNVDDVYWNDSIIYTYSRRQDIDNNHFIIVLKQSSDYDDFIVLDSLTRCQALDFLKQKDINIENLNKVNLSSSDFKDKTNLKYFIIFLCSVAIAVLLFYLRKLSKKEKSRFCS